MSNWTTITPMNCLNCGKDLSDKSDKAKYCSGKCSKAYRRRTKAGDIPAESDINLDTSTRTHAFKLTRTDRELESSKPDYYKFDDEVYKKQCFICKKDFKTRLPLNKLCSLKCKQKFFDFTPSLDMDEIIKKGETNAWRLPRLLPGCLARIKHL